MKPIYLAVACGGLMLSSLFATEPTDLDPILEQGEKDRIAAIATAKPSAVAVFVPGGAGGGSGVLISPDGYALTNFHVTSPAGSFMRCGLSDGRIYDAVIVGIDPVGDLAMIRLLGRDDFPYAEMGSSRAAKPGDWCMVIGNPFLLASNLQPTVTWGILSGVGRYQYPSGTLLEYGDCLQTDASINPGNSGGPIYDAKGRVIGIVGRASFEKRGRVNVGVGYAISINQAKNFLGYLRSGRIVDHATLGATVVTDPDGGVVVSNILDNSDAYRRGLRYGSEILEIDGRIVQTANDVQNILATFPNDWRVPMSFRQDGKTTNTLVRLRSVHLPDELLKKMSGALPPPPPRPQPKPDEGDEEKKSEEGGEKPKLGEDPHKMLPGLAKPKYPKSVQAQLIEREGYANYHFNNVQQERFINALREQSPGGKADEKVGWVIEAETEGEPKRNVQIRVDAEQTVMVLGNETFEADARGKLYDEVTDGSPAGILPALDAWRRMIERGTKKFGESYYLGSMPLGGQRPLRDCMIGIDGELEIRWLTHPESRLVEAVEVFADRDEDPAELWVMRENEGDETPTGLDLRYGVDSVLKLKIKSWESIASDAEVSETTDAEETDE
ncbi:MAG: trypsin-like peptidase domain-containing protein [Planctomycetota bacterium]